MTAWRSRQYDRLSTLLEYHEVMGGQKTLTSWLQRHPEDLRLLMRDALRFAPADGARPSPTPLGRASETALRAIGHSPNTEARDFLIDCCRSSRHIHLRRTAMRVLGETWGGDPAATAAILESVERGPDPELRVAALQWLTERCAHLPEVRELLYHCASADRDPAVRDHALRWMAQWWPDHPEYTALFVTDPRAADAPEPKRRAMMLQALATGGHEAEFKRQLAQENVPWIQNQMRHVERLRTAPGTAAPAVFHERLLTGLRRLLKARARAGNAD
ncbi:HEAT repeat domain-containing protein [Streptomyces hirsutus]|uniref:HEAT repeat domain-containing protein n=1 Tax=Streptomyces hirsutus TaxID=35620 RepID=UPI003625616E